MASDTVRLNLVYYGPHSPAIDAVIQAARPRYIIANTPHGLWGEIHGDDAGWLLRGVPDYRATGIRIIGYPISYQFISVILAGIRQFILSISKNCESKSSRYRKSAEMKIFGCGIPANRTGRACRTFRARRSSSVRRLAHETL